MNLLALFVVVFVSTVASSASPTSTYECGACMLLIHELESAIAKIDPTKIIDAGSFRVNPQGEQLGIKKVAYARSESHLSEILEATCDKAKEYKLVVNTLTGKAIYVHKDATYLKGDESNQMRYKLQSACNDLVDSHEDEIPKFLSKARADPVKEFCQLELGVCSAIDVSPLPPNEPPADPTPTPDGEAEKLPFFDDEL